MDSRQRAKRILALEYDWCEWSDRVREDIETLIAFEIEDAKRSNDEDGPDQYLVLVKNAAEIRAEMTIDESYDNNEWQGLREQAVKEEIKRAVGLVNGQCDNK